MLKFLLLAVIYQVKHFLADYPLQTPYMLQKFKEQDWETPLAAHAGALPAILIDDLKIAAIRDERPKFSIATTARLLHKLSTGSLAAPGHNQTVARLLFDNSVRTVIKLHCPFFILFQVAVVLNRRGARCCGGTGNIQALPAVHGHNCGVRRAHNLGFSDR